MITFLIMLIVIGSVVSATRVGKVRSLIQIAVTVLIIFALNGAFGPLTHTG